MGDLECESGRQAVGPKLRQQGTRPATVRGVCARLCASSTMAALCLNQNLYDQFGGCWAHSAQEWFRIEEDGIHAGSL